MAWTNIPSDQRAYVKEIEANLTKLRRIVEPATLYSTTAPTEAQVGAAWGTKYPPAYSPDLYEVMQWVDPSTNSLRNHYARIGTLGVQRPLVEFKTAPIPWTKLDEIYIDDAGGTATLTFSNINQSYTDLYVSVLMRSTANALTGGVNFRPNGSAAASYGYQYQGANTAGTLAAEGVSLTGVTVATPANTSHRAFYQEGLLRFFDYASILRPTRYHYRAVSLSGAALVQATSNNLNLHGVFNSLLPMTSLSIVGTTGWASGTRFVLFGV